MHLDFLIKKTIDMKPNFKFPNSNFCTQSLLNYFILLLLMISQSSCFKQFYQTNTAQKTDAPVLDRLQSEHKIFIVHTPAGVFGLRDVKVSNEALEGNKFFMDPKYDRYLNPLGETANPMARRDKGMALNEVHLYTDSTFGGSDQVVLAISQIKRIDVYGMDKKATSGSTVISIVGITVGVAAIIGAGAAAANSMSSGMSLNIPMN